MAKSQRSKHKRKMRAKLRVKRGPKLIKQLEETVKNNDPLSGDVEMSELVTVTDAKTVLDKKAPNPGTEAENTEGKVEGEADGGMDVDGKIRVYDKKTMRDQFGNYHPWMNSRRIKKVKRANQKNKQKKNNKKK